MKTLTKLSLLLLTCVVTLSGCEKKEMKDFADGAIPPSEITTGDVTGNFGFAIFVEDNNVNSDGGAAIEARGICYSSSVADPTFSVDTTAGILIDNAFSTGVGKFSTIVKGLDFSTLYYYRSYAMNAKGITYGPVKTVTTVATIPTVEATMTSAFFEEEGPILMEFLPLINHYVVKNAYANGYDISITIIDGVATVAPQTAYIHNTYGAVTMQSIADGTYNAATGTISLNVSFTVSAGSFGEFTEVFVVPVE